MANTTERKTVKVRVRRKVHPQNTGGSLPRNLPDIHVDELILEVPKIPDVLKKLPGATKIWEDICRNLIYRGKLKYNHLQVVASCVKWCALNNATPVELESLGYTAVTDNGYKPTLVSLYKTFTDEFLKCYCELTLTPKTEAYDCMLKLSSKSGCAQIDVETSSQKKEVIESDFDGF